MRRLLVLAKTTGYQTRAFGDAAARLGVDLAFATDRCDRIDDPWRDGAIAIRFHEEARAVDAIVESARARPIDGVLAVGDQPTVIAAEAARALGIPWHAPDAARAARHKLRTRERLRDAGLPAPWFTPLALDADLSAPANRPRAFPCVVKPVALSGSRGVIRANDPAEFDAAVERLRALLRSPDIGAERDAAQDGMLVEGFLPGREFALEGILHHGRLHTLAIFDKPDPLDGPFFEETIYATPSDAARDVQDAIVSAITAAACALGLSHGPIHAECRVDDRRGGAAPIVYVLEVAARPIGGLCARALRFVERGSSSSDPISLEEVLLRHALGESPDRWTRESLASGVMMIPIPRRGTFRGVDGVDDARAVAAVVDVQITMKPDQRLIPLPEGASYLGFIFARAETTSAVEFVLRRAHGHLRFRVDAEIPLLPSSALH